MPTPQDNLRVKKPIIVGYKMSPQQLVGYYISQRKVDRIYDADKAKMYRDKQNMYNSTLFGPSSPTNYDATTEEGQKKIDAAFEQTANNAKELVMNAAGAIVSSPFIGLIPRGRPIGGSIGRIEYLRPFKIGGGAEAEVFDNGVGSVIKVGSISKRQMALRNSFPNVQKSVYIGTSKSPYAKLNAFRQKRLKITTPKTFNKIIKKLDKKMEKAGFKKVKDPQVQYRAYTNGKYVIDDISPDNVGTTLFGSPRIVDMSVQTVPEWLALGYTLKKGGRLIPKHQNGDRVLYTGVKEFADKVHVNDDGTVTTPSGTTGNVVLPTITVKPQRSNWYLAGKHNTSPYWDSGTLSPIIDFIPGIGDVKGVNDMYDDFYHHRYAAGAIALGGMFLPNIIKKPLKYIGKGAKRLVRRGKKWVNAPERIDKAIDRITQIRDETSKQYEHFRGESQRASNIIGQLSPQERKELQNKAKDLYKKSTGKVYNAKRDIINKSVENYKQAVKENSNLLTLDKVPKDKRELYIQLSNEDPSYIEFTKQNNLPFDKQSTVDKWIEKQRTGIRGVYSDQPNAGKDILEPMFTETKDYNSGGDRLDSEGGVYVSNSIDIANRFSRSLSSEPGTAAYAIVKAPDIDRSVSIPQQLSQLRRRIFPSDLISSGLKFSNKDLLDLGYIGKQSQYTTGEGKLLPAYETVYFSDKPKTKVLEVSDFKTSDQTKNIAGRWGKGAGGASLTDNLYSPYKPDKSKGDFIHFYRTLNHAKIYNGLINALEWRSLQPYRERIILNTPKAPLEYLEQLNSRLYNQNRNRNVLIAKKNYIQNTRTKLKNVGKMLEKELLEQHLY